MTTEASETIPNDREYLTQKYSFTPSWTWPRPVAMWFDRELSSLTGPPRPAVHVCSGSSDLGDVTVDAFHESADLKADALQLPFKDLSVGTVITDPPWEWDPPTRANFGSEIHRVLEPGGLLLWCAPWIPAQGMFKREKLVVAAARVGLPKNARLLVRARKRGGPE